MCCSRANCETFKYQICNNHHLSDGGGARLGRGVDEPVTLGEYSLLTMNAFGITGGMMYTLIPSPRYAARELAFREVIQGRAYPRMDLSGERAIRIVGRVLDLDERGQLQ